jgi:hypothetical protein
MPTDRTVISGKKTSETQTSDIQNMEFIFIILYLLTCLIVKYSRASKNIEKPIRISIIEIFTEIKPKDENVMLIAWPKVKPESR